MNRKVALCVLLIFSLPAWSQDSLAKLAADFWSWRAQYQPFSSDDIPRIERPAGITRSWSATAVARQRSDLAAFETRWKKLDSGRGPVAEKVDYRLIGSALARVHWELDVNRRWQRDPTFYVEQTLTPVEEALAVPPPFDEARTSELIARCENISSILADARVNLKEPAAPFAQLAIDSLAHIRAQLDVVAHDLAPHVSASQASQLLPAIEHGASALVDFRRWLQQRLPSMTQGTAVGRDAYEYFFKQVALYPFTPEQLLQLSQQEWARSVVFEEQERRRNQKVAPLRMFSSIEDQTKTTAEMETQVRRFLIEKGILTIPPDFPHYTVRPLPAYLAALGDFGELDDFTGPSRLNQDCVRWAPAPSGKLGYFANANAHDPRPDMIHEGVPGHYFQLWLGWRNSDPIRRHYYDSGANEGLGFYAEEMMLEAGLFDGSPHTREIIYNFMRLRALRVEVDVKLALGEFTLEQAAKYLEEMVPMDPQTARSEAGAFATQPGLAISYQAGKLQITKFLAEARQQAGDRFEIIRFNDALWRNGNVPIALQRREWFNDPSGW
ncbi:MAG TPA: DUF885 family protein [Terriglobales bacterium]